MLYNILIYPLELIIEIVFYMFETFTQNNGIAILGVSIAVTLLSLPLYVIAERWQQIERDTQKQFKPRVDRIKKAFKGDEQYMMLSTFYKQNNYHPLYALRSSISLAIQVPFFIAAYNFLSNLEKLNGSSFFFISNLGQSDAMLTIGSFTVNVLPIAMTLINVIASAVYTKGFPLKEKIQLYVIAALFLVLLYDSPAGLVMYWTMNNILSLIKNIYYKTKNPKRALYFTILAAAIFALVWIINAKQAPFRILLVAICVAIVALIPLLIKFCKWLNKTALTNLQEDKKLCNSLFIFAALVLSLLCGIVSSSSLVASSPQEFSFIDNINNPLTFVKINLYQSFGLFFVWVGAFYVLFSKKAKSLITFFMTVMAVLAVIYTFFLMKDLGNISASLVFDTGIRRNPDLKDVIIDILIILATGTSLYFLFKFQPKKIVLPLLQIITAVFAVISVINCSKISKSYRELASRYNGEQAFELETAVSLSKTQKNVIVIMLDRAVNSYFPYITEERPDVKKAFEGFTYYPNTISIAPKTLHAAPPLTGGWEYTPDKINKRSNETLVSKHNEALTVLPRIFTEHGMDATMSDMPWANYSWIPDNSIYKNYPAINGINLEGKYTNRWADEHNEKIVPLSKIIKRNMFMFSLLKASPNMTRGLIFDNGNYCGELIRKASIKMFIDRFAVLDYLPEITDCNNEKGAFFFLTNNYTHDDLICQAPDYTPTDNVTDIGNGPFSHEGRTACYHVNAGAFIKLAEFMNYLRAQGIYDNTKIIIVSDHGEGGGIGTVTDYDPEGHLTETINPILLVKDFNSNGEIVTDSSFMSNADVPYLAVKDVIENPVNPFTGNKIEEHDKSTGITVYDSYRFYPEHNKTNEFILDCRIVNVKENMFIPSNYEKLQ